MARVQQTSGTHPGRMSLRVIDEEENQMWVFLSRRLRMWALFAIGAPILSGLLGMVGDRLEHRNGPGSVSRSLKYGRDWLRRRSRGPLAGRGRATDAGTSAR